MDGRTRALDAQALLEFAFVLPVMLLIMFALVDGSALFRASMACRAAAEEGARVLAQERGAIADGDLDSRIRQSVAGTDASGMTVATESVIDEVVPYKMKVPDSGKPYLETSRRFISKRVTCTKPCRLMIAGMFGASSVEVSESALSSYTMK